MLLLRAACPIHFFLIQIDRQEKNVSTLEIDPVDGRGRLAVGISLNVPRSTVSRTGYVLIQRVNVNNAGDLAASFDRDRFGCSGNQRLTLIGPATLNILVRRDLGKRLSAR